ncbi:MULTISPECIES: hypothetical protein [unclassified Eikenella]|uniref:hypothetical protein n=1 Tax=unclassified Eikenella TaxID=2639367 RepID=UPI0008A36FBC|nr:MULTISPECIES: hypothetical protein [unclassified Eikenella]OFK88749.1 hypothetical protein HMPREF2796_04200 [Eikenella sp. HMSC071B05]OFO45515.1 hypothetical protein HMPREF3043_05645 [Eikenella sp. HMSC073A11]
MIEETKSGNRPSSSKPPYAWRVLIIYSLFGSPLGAVLLLIGLSDPNSQYTFRLIPIAILFSYPVGGIPAFLTGLLAILLRLRRNLPGIAAMTAAGALLSGIWWLVMDMFSGFDFTACGAAAAFVLSVFLPKPAK